MTGASGRVGRLVVDQLLGAGVPVRTLVRRPDAAATLPAKVDVVTGDLTAPESLEAGLRGVEAVFLVWTAPPATVRAVIERLAEHARRVVFLSSPHQTPHPFLPATEPPAVLHADIERFIASTGIESTIVRPGMFASNVVSWWSSAIRTSVMLLAAWAATLGRPAFITSMISDILGRAPRSFRQWVADHTSAFT